MHTVQVVFMGCCLLLAIVAVTYVLTRTKPVYLINYHVYRPPDRCIELLLCSVFYKVFSRLFTPSWTCPSLVLLPGLQSQDVSRKVQALVKRISGTPCLSASRLFACIYDFMISGIR